MFFILDEAQNFVNESVSILLEEMRKYGLRMILAHHYFHQFDKEKLRVNLISNCRIKCIGMNSQEQRNYVQRKDGIEAINPKKLQHHRFLIHRRGKDSMYFKAPKTYIKNWFWRLRNPRFLKAWQEKELDRYLLYHSGIYRMINPPPDNDVPIGPLVKEEHRHSQELYSKTSTQAENTTATPMLPPNAQYPILSAKYPLRSWQQGSNQEHMSTNTYSLSQQLQELIESSLLKQDKVLQALGYFRFLSHKHRVQLGITPTVHSAQRLLEELQKKGHVEAGKHPAIREKLYCLSQQGVTYLKTQLYQTQPH